MFDIVNRLMNSTAGMFIMGIITNWYLIIMVPAVTAAYLFLKALSDNGMLAKFEKFTVDNFSEILHIVEKCTPQLINMQRFIDCLPN